MAKLNKIFKPMDDQDRSMHAGASENAHIAFLDDDNCLVLDWASDLSECLFKLEMHAEDGTYVLDIKNLKGVNQVVSDVLCGDAWKWCWEEAA